MAEYLLEQRYGYGIILGLGALFSILMIGISYVLSRYMNQKQTSERFSTASRDVKQGLISSAVVSSWSWPATLMTSSYYCVAYGIQGCYWYAAVGCFQILIFTLVALEIKRRCPGIHTIAEIAKARFGKWGHLVYLFYCFGTNIMISGMILLGGSQGVAYSTGMNVVAACFLLPISVCVYTLFGGLQATFISDWTHTAVIFVIILVSLVTVYGTSGKIGSLDKMYDMLHEVSQSVPLAGAVDGSYLTFSSKDMILNAWNLLLSGAATVFMDPSYSQKAIAAGSKQVMWGYALGAFCWQTVPIGLGSSIALASIALIKTPGYIAYPDGFSTEDLNHEMPFIYGMAGIFGKSGAATAVVMIFLSATSAMSAELISCSSILTYDIYRTYIDPNATGKRLITVSHICVFVFSICMGGIAVLFNYIGVTLGWLFSFVGIALGSAFFSLLGMLFYRKMNTLAMCFGAPLATAAGIGAWLGASYHYSSDGTVNKASLSLSEPLAYGNFVSVFSSAILIWIFSQYKPQNFNFETMNEEFFEKDIADDADEEELKYAVFSSDDSLEEKHDIRKHLLITKILIISHAAIFLFIIPLSMYGTKYVFSRKFFKGFIVIVIIWSFISALWIVLYPAYESRIAIVTLFRRLWARDISDSRHTSKEENKDIAFVGDSSTDSEILDLETYSVAGQGDSKNNEVVRTHQE